MASARWPSGGVSGAPVAGAEVSRLGGTSMMAVTPLPRDARSRTRMPWRVARLPAT
jgi:hypothetical protein